MVVTTPFGKDVIAVDACCFQLGTVSYCYDSCLFLETGYSLLR